MDKYENLKEYGFNNEHIFDDLNPGSLILITDCINSERKEIDSYVMRINSMDFRDNSSGITIMSPDKDELGLSWSELNTFKFKIIKEV